MVYTVRVSKDKKHFVVSSERNPKGINFSIKTPMDTIERMIKLGGDEANIECKKCCICGEWFNEWGNNPWPIKLDGSCCDRCNNEAVIPARLKVVYHK